MEHNAEIANLEEEIKNLSKNSLSVKRFNHVENVVKEAEILALRFDADPVKARLAAWLHDIVKEKNQDELWEIISKDEKLASQTKERPFKIWHGPAAAVIGKMHFGIEDEEIFQSVCNHTTGRANMTKQEKILYLADMISAERDYEGVEKIRETAQKNLDKAVYDSLVLNAEHVKSKDYEMDEQTLNALEYYETFCK